jgi:hypothetical protein
MAFRSDRPLYARIFLALSILFLFATFLPFIYSILFPNEDLQRVVSALEGRGSPPLDADSVIEEAKQAAGTLTHSIQIAYGAGRAVRYARSGPAKPEHMRRSEATYLAWFQKRPKPMIIAISVYENETGQKAFGINEVNPAALVQGYLLPIAIFVIALVLVRRKKSQTAIIAKGSDLPGQRDFTKA